MMHTGKTGVIHQKRRQKNPPNETTRMMQGNVLIECDSMEEIIKKAISDSVRETVMQARENSVFTDEGRIFLDASASLYGAAVNNDGLIIDENGNVMTDKDPLLNHNQHGEETGSRTISIGE